MEQIATTQPLHYRLFQEDDLPGILKLWKEESGWGDLTREKWYEWYSNAFYEPCLVVVAANERDIVAQAVFIPTQVVVGKQTLKALRLSAPILHRKLRQKSLRQTTHPVISLYFTGIEEAIQSGYSLVYSLPDYGWLPFFRWGRRIGLPQFHDAEYECFEFQIDKTTSVGHLISNIDNLAIRRVTSFNDQYDLFWESIQNSSIQCSVVRKSSWLNYKYRTGVIILEFLDQETNRLQAYLVIRQDGLLVDMLCHPSINVMMILSATLKWLILSKNECSLESIHSLKVMATPLLKSALEALQFKPVNFKFAFVCTSISPSLSMDSLTPDTWYVMPGD